MIHKIELTEVVLMKPRPYRLKIPNLLPEHRWLENRYWTTLEELYDCLLFAFEKYSVARLQPLGIFGRYGLLCGQKGGKPLYTWVIFGTSYTAESPDLPPDDVNIEKTYIPYTWASDIIEHADRGVIRVISREIDGPKRVPIAPRILCVTTDGTETEIPPILPFEMGNFLST